MAKPKPDLTIKEGDTVQVTLDDGSKVVKAVESDPWQVCGQWVVKLNGISGGYLLDRCKKLTFKPLQCD